MYNANGIQCGYDEKFYYVARIIKNNMSWENEIPVEELSDIKWILKISQGKCFIEKRFVNLFVKYIRIKLNNNYPVKKCYVTSGWKRINGKFHYVHKGGIIGGLSQEIQGSSNYCLNYTPYLLGTREIFDKGFNMRNVIKKEVNGTTIFYFTLISLLTTFFKEANFQVKFILSLIGKTNSKKTSCGLLFTKIFDRTQVTTPDISFRSTAGAIEESMEKFSDACLLVDDFAPQETKSLEREQNSKLELLVRSYGDRIARQRMSGYVPQGAKPYHVVGGCCVVTGEIEAGVSSSKTRMIKLDFEKDGTNDELLLYYQQNLDIWSNFLADFICYSSENANAIISYIKNEAPNYRRSHMEEFSIPRFAESYAVFCCIIDIFYEFVKNRAFMEESDRIKYKQKDLMLLKQVIQNNEESIRNSDPVNMFVRAIYGSILDKNIYLCEIGNIIHNQKSIIDSKMMIEDEEFYYIRATDALNVVENYFKKRGKKFQLDTTNSLLSALVNENLLLTRMEGEKPRRTLKIKGIKYTNDRFMHISKKRFHELLELEE